MPGDAANPVRPRLKRGHRIPAFGRLRPRSAIAILVLLIAFVPGVRAGNWQTVFEQDGLLVEQRPYGDSPLMELRGQVNVRASLNAVMALLKDADYNRQWVYRSGGARILEESGYRQAYVYGVVDAPWPMQDRDTVVRFDYTQDSQTRVIHIEITNFPEFHPAQRGLVRVPDFGGFWSLAPLEGGEVHVTYQVHGDPGGWVPTWMANYAAQLSVINTLRAMPDAVANYLDAKSEEVRE